mmetsp:Transcript_52132/g.153836  ORF Transcript_52132/g.153836 Transcript_52132/m.153836 type:complete len:277 (+) Transcript_52132:577-1407(+)
MSPMNVNVCSRSPCSACPATLFWSLKWSTTIATRMFARRKTMHITKAMSQTMAETGAISLMAAKSPLPNRRASVVRLELEMFDQCLSSRPKSTMPPTAKFSKTMKRMIPAWKRSPEAEAMVRPMAARRGWPMKPRKKRAMTTMVYQNMDSLWYILIVTSVESPSMTSVTACSCAPEAVYQSCFICGVALAEKGVGVGPNACMSASPLPTAPVPKLKTAKNMTIPIPKNVDTKSVASQRYHAVSLPLRSENSCSEETKPPSRRRIQTRSMTMRIVFG